MKELKGWQVLVMILAFFGVTIAVNVGMSFYAITTFSGEDVPNPYLKGLAYNQTLAAHAAQAELGWRAAIDARRAGSSGATIEVTIDGGEPSKVAATLRRPTDAGLDRTIELAAQGDGRYAGTATDVAAGQWDVIVRTTAADGTAFEATRRVMLP